MRIQFFILITFSFFSFSLNIYAQDDLQFGNLSAEDLSNQVYKPEPGADAVILSDIGIAKLSYTNGFYIDFERDVRIRIINSNGFDYADIEIPYSTDDDLMKYRASTFNLRNGEKTETPITKKSFIIEKSSKYRNLLKFNFPDVHEGSVIEYSYVLRMKGESLSTLVPWIFQASIPVEHTSLTIVYPEFFIYKTNISGNPLLVSVVSANRQQNFGGRNTRILTYRYSANKVPSFNPEPFMKSMRENQTRLTFELASVDFPGSSKEEITPTYETLTGKLLERNDFGLAISKAAALKKIAVEITMGFPMICQKQMLFINIYLKKSFGMEKRIILHRFH